MVHVEKAEFRREEVTSRSKKSLEQRATRHCAGQARDEEQLAHEGLTRPTGPWHVITFLGFSVLICLPLGAHLRTYNRHSIGVRHHLFHCSGPIPFLPRGGH